MWRGWAGESLRLSGRHLGLAAFVRVSGLGWTVVRSVCLNFWSDTVSSRECGRRPSRFSGKECELSFSKENTENRKKSLRGEVERPSERREDCVMSKLLSKI